LKTAPSEETKGSHFDPGALAHFSRIGIPDGWVLNTSDTSAYKKLLAEGSKFVPVVLAEEVTVRRKHGSIYADTHVSTVVSGVSELVGKWSTGDISYKGFSPSQLFPAGSQIFCWKEVDGTTNRHHINLCAAPDVRVQRGNFVGNEEYTCPIGEFLFPALTLPANKDGQPGYYSNVYIDTLTSKELRQMIDQSRGDFDAPEGSPGQQIYSDTSRGDNFDVRGVDADKRNYRFRDETYGLPGDTASEKLAKEAEKRIEVYQEEILPLLTEAAVGADALSIVADKGKYEAAIRSMREIIGQKGFNSDDNRDAGGPIDNKVASDRRAGDVDDAIMSLKPEYFDQTVNDTFYYDNAGVLKRGKVFTSEAARRFFYKSVPIKLRRVVGIGQVPDAYTSAGVRTGIGKVGFSHGPKLKRSTEGGGNDLD
jgi:hypothetical protein